MASLSVLVVDDDRDTLELFAAALSFVGFVVTTATNGFAALRAIGNRKHDAVVVHIAMAGTDGNELIERLRSEELLPVPVIVITGQGDCGMVREANKSACAVFTKPCDLRELAERLDTLIRTCPRDCVVCTARHSLVRSGHGSEPRS